MIDAISLLGISPSPFGDMNSNRYYRSSPNFCPCCGAPMNAMQNADIFNQLQMLQAQSDNSIKRKLPTDEEMKDRFEKLSSEIEAAEARLNTH